MRRGVRRQEGLHLPLVVLARLPDHLHGSLALRAEYPRLHHLVERARAERPAHHKHHREVGREPVTGQRLGAVGTLFREAAAQRIARQHDPVGRKEAFHPLVGRADAAGAARKDLVRDPRIGVLLLDDGRHVHALGRPQHRGAGISAEAHHRIGPEVADRPPRQAQRAQHLERHGQVVPVQAALQPRNRQAHDPVTQCRDLLHLHLSLGPHEEELDLVAQTPFERLGNRYGRVDMASRTAA
uniref:Uncharacterized protein n=1 Tax=Siphoviridae sp. ctBLh2 TaxID=2827803 RepID=A0A8S5S3U9_9CAUD|nr:MAG TPA: hypothetical protein [Siphoviridae sp. ctBLh2]